MRILDPNSAANFALATAVAHRFPPLLAASEGVDKLQEEPPLLHVEYEHRRHLGSSPRRAEGVEKNLHCREPSRNPTHRQGPSGKDPLALRSILNKKP
jgi:hypothetical protein